MATQIDDPSPALLTVERAAGRLMLGRSKVFELLARGEIPSVKVDGSRRIRARDLDAYVERLGTPRAA